MQATIQSCNDRRYGRKIINGLAVCALLLAGTFSAAGAICNPSLEFAYDTKVFPGTMCRQIGTTSTVYYDGNGRVLNTTTSPVTVICPIVRDANQTKWQFVDVVVADRNPNANVTCSARSNQTDGLGWSSNPINPLPVGFVSLNWWESQTLTFSSQTEERHDGTYFISCTIPPRYTNDPNYDSGIYSYRIRESGGCTDFD